MTTTGYLPPGALWVPDTVNRQDLHSLANLVLEDRGIALVDGPQGLGKTCETIAWAEGTGVPWVYVQIDDQAPAVEIDVLLLAELGIATPDSMQRYRRKLLLTDKLAEREIIVITDEVGTAPLATLRRLRTMHDRRGARWTWIAVGSRQPQPHRQDRRPAQPQRRTDRLRTP